MSFLRLFELHVLLGKTQRIVLRFTNRGQPAKQATISVLTIKKFQIPGLLIFSHPINKFLAKYKHIRKEKTSVKKKTASLEMSRHGACKVGNNNVILSDRPAMQQLIYISSITF